MAVVEQEPANTSEISNFRYGRNSDVGLAGRRVRSWLQAEVRARLIDVRSCSDNRHGCGEVCFRYD